MSGAVVMMLVALGVAAALSVVVWLLSRRPAKRSPTLLEHLRSLADADEPPVGPSSGIGPVEPLKSGEAPRPASAPTPGRGSDQATGRARRQATGQVG